MGEEDAMRFSSMTYRHQIPNPKWYNPFNKRSGAGISQLDLTLSKGQIVGLVGTNGAGKTTLLRMMSGILPLQEGNVSLHGSNMGIDELRSKVGLCRNKFDGRVSRLFAKRWQNSLCYEVVLWSRHWNYSVLLGSRIELIHPWNH
jgi:ABC-type molybdenum transport system ATPase subunit/photorepair protein PhrA